MIIKIQLFPEEPSKLVRILQNKFTEIKKSKVI